MLSVRSVTDYEKYVSLKFSLEFSGPEKQILDTCFHITKGQERSVFKDSFFTISLSRDVWQLYRVSSKVEVQIKDHTHLPATNLKEQFEIQV